MQPSNDATDMEATRACIMKLNATSNQEFSGARKCPILDFHVPPDGTTDSFSAISSSGKCDGTWMLRSGRTSLVNEEPALWVRKAGKKPKWTSEGEPAALPKTVSVMHGGGVVLVFSGEAPATPVAGAARAADLLASMNVANFSRPNGMDGSKAFTLKVAKTQFEAIKSPGELALFLAMVTDLMWAPNEPVAYGALQEGMA